MQSGEMRGRLAEIAVVVVIFLGLAGVAFWQFATSFAAQNANSGGPFDNAAMFPRLIAWALIILGILQIAKTLILGATGASATPAGRKPESGSQPVRPEDGDDALRLTLRAVGCLATFVLYLSIVTTVGYIATTIVMLLTMFTILGARPIVALAVAVGATFVAGFVFGTLLKVVLPVGRLGLPTVF